MASRLRRRESNYWLTLRSRGKSYNDSSSSIENALIQETGTGAGECFRAGAGATTGSDFALPDGILGLRFNRVLVKASTRFSPHRGQHPHPGFPGYWRRWLGALVAGDLAYLDIGMPSGLRSHSIGIDCCPYAVSSRFRSQVLFSDAWVWLQIGPLVLVGCRLQ